MNGSAPAVPAGVSDLGFEPVARRSLPDSIAEQLSRRLEAGEFEPGQRLPGHRRLATAFGVSLPVVREALSRLVAQGWLEIRPGDGTFVRPSPNGHDPRGPFEVDATSEQDLLDILEARTVLEVALAGFAADRADAGRADTLQRLVDRMREARDDQETFLEADLAFHLALSEAAANAVLLQAMLGLRSSMRRFLAARSDRQVGLGHITERALAGHQAIVDAVRDGDATAARAAVTDLMARTRRDLTET